MKDTKGQVIAYLRVSTGEQNMERQYDLKIGADKVFEEHASAGSRQRPELEKMIEWAREGDTVKVWSIDRLARSLQDLQAIVSELKANGVCVVFEKEGMRFDPAEEKQDPFQNLMFQILGSFAEFERAIMKSRQREGIAKAKEAGKYKGRKSVLTDEVVATAKERFAQGVSVSRIAKDAGISRASVYKALDL